MLHVCCGADPNTSLTTNTPAAAAAWSLNTSDCLDVGKCLMSAYFIIGHQTPPVAAVPLLILIFLTHGSYGL